MAPQPFIPFPNGAQVEFISFYLGEIVENRLWFLSRFIPIDQDLIDALAVGASAWYRGEIMPVLSDDLQLQVVRARAWDADPAPFVGVDTTPALGGVSGGGYSANVSIRVRFNGDDSQTFRDNSNFIPAIPLNAVNGNYYTTAIRNALFDAYVSLIDLAGTWTAGNDWRWVITSRRLHNEWREEQVYARTDHPLFPSPVVSPRRKRLPKPIIVD